MSAPESREERYARIRAVEDAARILRASLPPIDPDALKIAMGGATTTDEHGHPVCGRCRYGEPVGVLFGIVVDGVGKLCEDCVTPTGRRGEALVQLVEAVEDLDTAIAEAPPEDRLALVAALRVVVTDWLPARFGLLDPVSPQ